MSDREFVSGSQEVKFDVRLQDKRIEHGFMTRDELNSHLKGLPEETEYAFSSDEKAAEEAPAEANTSPEQA